MTRKAPIQPPTPAKQTMATIATARQYPLQLITYPSAKNAQTILTLPIASSLSRLNIALTSTMPNFAVDLAP